LQTAWQESADALRLLPLFLSMRAAIRSNVLFTKRRLAPDQADDAADAKAYFDLALRYIEPARPSLVAIGGKSGTGKSVLARETAPLLAPLPGAVVLRSDVIRKELFGVDPLVALPEDAYTPEVTARVYQTLLERSRQILDQGCSVVVDAAFLKQPERDELSAAAQKLDVAFHAVFLTADLDVRLDRIGARKADASDATAEIAKGQEDYETGRIDWPIVDASGSPEQTLQRSRPVLVP
jgi:predicted kinase